MPDVPIRKIIAAMRGNSAATAEIIRWGLPRLSGKVDHYRREIEYRRENVWEPDDARKRAMGGDVPPEQTVGAFSDVQTKLIRVLALTPAAMMADQSNVEKINEMWNEAVLQLLLALHNPSIKYGIIGGMAPEVREEAEEYVERYSRELWGTVQALASDEQVEAGDFPPETGSVIRSVGDAFRDRQAQRSDD